ncbi:unnamed protein product [Schistosoma turkestanicum]|nr:unnamed protein product [Schistosoma turkestanicum]
MPTGDKQPEKHKKESIIDLNKYIDKRIRVKFSGGREAVGILKGCDNLQNMVIDCTTEFLRDPDDPHRLTEDTRELGLVVCSSSPVVKILSYLNILKSLIGRNLCATTECYYLNQSFRLASPNVRTLMLACVYPGAL